MAKLGMSETPNSEPPEPIDTKFGMGNYVEIILCILKFKVIAPVGTSWQ